MGQQETKSKGLWPGARHWQVNVNLRRSALHLFKKKISAVSKSIPTVPRWRRLFMVNLSANFPLQIGFAVSEHAVLGALYFKIYTCVCICSVRESRSGPARMVTMIAARMYNRIMMFGMNPPGAANEMGRNAPAVLPLAWKIVTSSRLPRVLLYNQVYKTASATTKTKN